MAPEGMIMMIMTMKVNSTKDAAFSHLFQLGDSTGAQLETYKGVYNGAAGCNGASVVCNGVMMQLLRWCCIKLCCIHLLLILILELPFLKFCFAQTKI